jgi:signal transduction histidine kinase
MKCPPIACKIAVMFIFFVLPATILCGQESVSRKIFDSICNEVLKSLSNDVHASQRYLDNLMAKGEPLSDIQRARLAYLQMRIINANGTGGIFRSSGIQNPSGGMALQDSLQFYSRRYLERSMPDMAIPLLMRALDILPVNSPDADHAGIELCEAYRQKQEYKKGIELIGYMLERQAPLTDRNRAYAYNRMAALYNESCHPVRSYTDSVFKYSLLCKDLSERTGNKPDLAASQNELAYQYTRRKDYNKAMELSQQAVSNFLASGLPFYAMNALINQSNIFIHIKDYGSALRSLEEATRLAPLWENRNLYLRLYMQYANIYTATGDYRVASEFLRLCIQLQSDFFKDRINSQIVEQSARYDLFVKEQKIREEQEKNEYKRKQIILLFILTIGLAFAIIISYFYFRQSKKVLIRQKMIGAVLETETNERRRIARDLHDGLGPLLSAINHYFQAFLDAKPENRESIQARLQTVISDSIDEVSRISHNISPHVLEKHGLMTALNNLMAPLTAQGRYEVLFTSGLEERPDPKTELTVYRCITELLNNTMKHAEAKRITLDIRRSGNQLLIHYSDNGKGFDITSGNQSGMGLHNIRNRVESSGGSLLMDSSRNTGILVNITIPVLSWTRSG